MSIIHEVYAKITENHLKNQKAVFEEHQDISAFIKDTKMMLDEIGVLLIKDTLESADEVMKASPVRKKDWYVQRSSDEKTLLTEFGSVRYRRTYYRHKSQKRYSYLSDESLGIDKYERLDRGLRARLIDNALDVSYEKSANQFNQGTSLSRQSVLNSIRKLGAVENERAHHQLEQLGEKKQVVNLYIEADEDHVALQTGQNKQTKLIYVHEGKQALSKRRNQLKNVRYFTGDYASTETLWLEVATYLDTYYDLDACEHLFLSGDGAAWIKEGLNWIPGSQYVLDYFHLSKAVTKASAHMPHTKSVLWGYLHRHQKQDVNDLLDVILQETESETKRETIKESKRYINNHWKGIVNRSNKAYVGCSAEGHISHVLSDRLSSRPMGWSKVGADEMARLRVFRANGGSVYDVVKEKAKEEKKAKKTVAFDKRIVRGHLNKKSHEKLDNITILNTGKKTWARELLKSIRGA